MTNNIWWLSVNWKFVIDCCRWFSLCRWSRSRKKNAKLVGRRRWSVIERINTTAAEQQQQQKKYINSIQEPNEVCAFSTSEESAQHSSKSFNIPTRQWKNNSNIEFTINKTNWQSYVERWLPAWNYYFITVESSLRWSDEKLISDSLIPSICSGERKKIRQKKEN